MSVAFGKTYQGYTMIDDLKTKSVGASFNAGFLTVQGSVEQSDYSTTNQRLMSGGVLIPVGSGTIKLNYTRATGSSDAFQANLLGAGYVYDLSKRTSVYVGYGRITNGGSEASLIGARYTASSGGPAISNAAGVRVMKLGETSTGYDVGVRHNF